ncbi:hypothetical protein IWX90DRAFT_490830 [Phyllosticta citrichinensis]|uniref:Pre-mRNA-splicing factor CWC24 n=1 Tax=Phyllosticta citrichinensis TaxID=1130410 RepID=A0ABR1XF53_9PEZI
MDAPVVFKKRSGKGAPRRVAPPPRSPSASSDADSGSDGDDGRKVKRRKTTSSAVVNASSAAQKTKIEVEGVTKYAADTSASIKDNNDATKQSNWYDENAPEALSAANLLGKLRTKKDADNDNDEGRDGTYKGQKNYSNFIQKSADGPKVGPVKPINSNVRMVTQIDYAPDVCKDYKQTGFCGFGDSCKFLHAREDYAAGWKLDREWEINTKGKKLGGTVVSSANRDAKTGEDEENEEEAKLLEKIPFACIICKKPYAQPVVTNCGHYFCEKCALTRFRKNPSCAVCGAGTGGRFNDAKNLKKLLEKKREREWKKKEKLREEGQDISDGEGED